MQIIRHFYLCKLNIYIKFTLSKQVVRFFILFIKIKDIKKEEIIKWKESS
jgi:hypothetical protein